MTKVVLSAAAWAALTAAMLTTAQAATIKLTASAAMPDFSDTTPEVITVQSGGTVDVYYWADFTGDETLGGGTDFFYDAAVADSSDFTFSPPDGHRDTAFDTKPDHCTAPDMPHTQCSGNGEAHGMFFGDLAGLEGPTMVGFLTLEVLGGPGTSTLITMAPSEEGPPSGRGGFYDTSDENMNARIEFVGVELQVVPVPAAAWLLLSGLAALAGLPRRTRS